MKSSSPEVFPGSDLTGKHHASSIDGVQRREQHDENRAYRLVSTNFGVILNVTFNIRAPNNRVIIRLKESHDILSPRFNGSELFLAKDTWQILLNGSDSNGSNVVTEDTERCDGLPTCELRRIVGGKLLTG